MKIKHLVLFTLLALVASASKAATITLDVVEANWTVTGGKAINYVDADGVTGNEEVYWGTETYLSCKLLIFCDEHTRPATPQSGYKFDPAAPPAVHVDLFDEFTLGAFTHINSSINKGSQIKTAQLDLTAYLSIDGVQQEEAYVFSFLHNETHNNCKGEGCSDDIVTFSNVASTDKFVVDGIEYTLELLGFQDENGSLVNSVKTPEKGTSTVDLVAAFTSAASVAEPATLAMLSLGLLGLGAARRRRV